MFERLCVSSVAIVGVKIISALKKLLVIPQLIPDNQVCMGISCGVRKVCSWRKVLPQTVCFWLHKSNLLREEHLDRIKLEGGKALILLCRDGHPAFSHA